jgi:hypothetical protein
MNPFLMQISFCMPALYHNIAARTYENANPGAIVVVTRKVSEKPGVIIWQKYPV